MNIREKIASYCCQEGDCQVWQGGTDSGDVPQIRHDGRVQSVRRLLLTLNGLNLKGKLATVKCDNPRCVADAHLIAVTRKQLVKRAAQRTQYGKRVERRIAIAKAQRERGHTVLDMEKARAMRASGMTSREAAKAFGVCQYTAWAVLSGRTWVDYANPFAGLARAA